MGDVPKMRTISQAFDEIKTADTNTALTERALRCAVKRGEIPCVKIGSKTLVSMDAVAAYMKGAAVVPLRSEEYGTIRPLSERR